MVTEESIVKKFYYRVWIFWTIFTSFCISVKVQMMKNSLKLCKNSCILKNSGHFITYNLSYLYMFSFNFFIFRNLIYDLLYLYSALSASFCWYSVVFILILFLFIFSFLICVQSCNLYFVTSYSYSVSVSFYKYSVLFIFYVHPGTINLRAVIWLLVLS